MIQGFCCRVFVKNFWENDWYFVVVFLFLLSFFPLFLLQPAALAQVAALAARVPVKPQQSWGAAVAAFKDATPLCKTLLHRFQDPEWGVPTLMAVLAKTCPHSKAFDSARQELGLQDLNFL